MVAIQVQTNGENGIQCGVRRRSAVQVRFRPAVEPETHFGNSCQPQCERFCECYLSATIELAIFRGVSAPLDKRFLRSRTNRGSYECDNGNCFLRCAN